ncbi:hypothetical protein ACH5RR_041390 [Cinchona calisaya]|uniref:Uncharacterized protein n=1 Tax=Cinchona calisaya TaxID=153742 RepID=A0ABD2XU74_9GENT
MGREFPAAENNHPFITISLFIACFAATIAVVSSLCGALSRKKQPSSPVAGNEIQENVPSPNDHNNNNNGSPSKDTFFAVPVQSASGPENAMQNEEVLQQPLPPPPGMQRLSGIGAASYHFRSNSSASSSSQRKLPTSMSMRVLGKSRQASRRDLQDNNNNNNNNNNNSEFKKKEKKLKHEDSVWKKTIILGEKCKVPDEDEDTILYDEKGNRISTYHRKSTSMALSRQGSNIDADAISTSCEGQKDELVLRNS